MYEKNVMAIARWVTKDGMDPKMGVLAPSVFEKVDCLLRAHVRHHSRPLISKPGSLPSNLDPIYTFASLENFVSKTGQVTTSHPYISTDEQLADMDKFVNVMAHGSRRQGRGKYVIL